MNRAAKGGGRARANSDGSFGHCQGDNFIGERQLAAQLAAARTEATLFSLVCDHATRMNSIHCATALHRWAKCSSVLAGKAPDCTPFRMLCARTADLLHADCSLTARSLTSIAWAVGKLQLADVRIHEGLVRRARVALSAAKLDGCALANLAWWQAKAREQHAADTRLLDEIAAAAAARLHSFSTQEVTNLVWAFATLKRRHRLLFDATEAELCRRTSKFSAQGVSQVVWAFAKVGLHKYKLLLSAAAAAMSSIASYDGHSLASLTWAFANLQVEHGGLVHAICVEVLRRANLFDLEAITQLLWSLSRLSDGVDARALHALLARLNALTASATGLPASCLVPPEVPSAGEQQSAPRHGRELDALRPQQLLYVLGALARLPEAFLGNEQLIETVAVAAAAAAATMTANRLGIAAWALSRPQLLLRLSSAARKTWRAALRSRCTDGSLLEHLSWRAIGHIEVALRGLPPFDDAEPLLAALTAAAVHAVAATALRAAAQNMAPARLAVRLSPWSTLSVGAQVLVAGFDEGCEEICASLVNVGCTPCVWRRFAASSHDDSVRAWPELGVTKPPFDIEGVNTGSESAGRSLILSAAVVRWPWYAAGTAAAMLFQAVGSLLPLRAPMWVFGQSDEGAHGCSVALTPLFEAGQSLLAEDGSLVVAATRSAAPPSAVSPPAAASPAGDGAAANYRGGDILIQAWRSQTTLEFPPPPPGPPPDPPSGNFRRGSGAAAERVLMGLPWVVYPGLFAGGGLDVMTAALLQVLPLPPPGTRALDFACGSGAIGAVLAARCPSLRLHLLDADALAIEAARCNVSSARRFFLSAGWPEALEAKRGKRFKYGWIVSNPPVHKGQPDQFETLVSLISGARLRLTRSGTLWIVAQQHVPVGRLLAAYGRFARVRAKLSADGRFVVWSAGGRMPRKGGVKAFVEGAEGAMASEARAEISGDASPQHGDGCVKIAARKRQKNRCTKFTRG